MAGFEVTPHGRFCTDPRGLFLILLAFWFSYRLLGLIFVRTL